MSLVPSLVLTTLMVTAAPSKSVEGEKAPEPVIRGCQVSIIHEAEVPAQEPGVLIKLEVREGMHVLKDSLLGSIDDADRQLQKEIATIEHNSAKEQAENDINVRYARAAAKVSQSEYDQAVEANHKVKGAFPEAEVRRLLLAWRRADLQIEQSEVDLRIAGHTMKTRAAEVSAADMNIRHRQIRAPLEGEVVSLLKHTGEWVTPGEPVLRIVHLQHLRIQGFLDISKFHPAEITGKPVTVHAKLTRDKEVEFQGTIVYVSPLIESGGEYRVWAEVENQKYRGQWLLMPGLPVKMTIHTNQPATPADSVRTAPKSEKPDSSEG